MVEVVMAFVAVASIGVGVVKVIWGEMTMAAMTFFKGEASFFLAVTIATTSAHFIERPAIKTDRVRSLYSSRVEDCIYKTSS